MIMNRLSNSPNSYYFKYQVCSFSCFFFEIINPETDREDRIYTVKHHSKTIEQNTT